MRSIVSIIIAFFGGIWLYGMKILNWIGRMLDTIQLGNYATDFQIWLVNNPNLANEYGPWALIGAGVISLAATHLGPPFYKMWKQDALEIVYDPADEKGQFGGVGLWNIHGNTDPPLKMFIFRVGIKNNTRKTIYEVTGTIEGDLIPHGYPVALRFSRSQEFGEALHPKRMLLMDVFALSPDPASWAVPEGVHSFVIRINGKDTPEASQAFNFDQSRMPALYKAV